MKRYILCPLVLLASFCSIGASQDILPVVFDASEHVSGGKKLKYDLYYIFVVNKGALRTGDLLQIYVIAGDPPKFRITKAQFTANSSFEDVSNFWPVHQGKKVGNVEKAKITERHDGKLVYSIYDHDDESQIGQNETIRIVDFRRLPEWLRNAAFPHILAKLPLEMQLQYHKNQAAMIDAFGKAALEYAK